MAFDELRSLDIAYDNKTYGNLVDPYEWNANFKKVEDVSNENKTIVDDNFAELAANTGSSKIGAPALASLGQSVDSTVAEQIELLATNAANVYNKNTVDGMVAGCIKNFAYVPAEGKFVVTWYNDTTSVIDTNLEKVPASMALVVENDNTYLRITNDDGSYTQTDVTSLIDAYTFNDGNTVTFSANGYNVTAEVKNGSIGFDKFTLDLQNTISSVAANALSAQTSATNAANSASSANTSAVVATNKATDAGSSATSASSSATNAGNFATIANNKATEANTSAVNAAASEANALSYKNTANTKASEAASSATIATEKASIATTKATQASTSETNAFGYMTAASDSADDAAESALIAINASEDAEGFASDASASAVSANASAVSSEENAILSQSWAVGSTGTRTGEDTNNAKYWSDLAQAAAGGDYTTNTEFNAYVSSQVTAMDNKVDKVAGKGLSTNDYTTEEKSKLAGIATNANNYVHPTTAGNKHIPTGGASGQVLKYSASGTAVWAADNDTVTTINGKTGTIAKSDIVALGIPAQDTVYTHPSTHSADMITDGTANKVFTATEKTKLGGIATNANNYTHPTTAGNKHIPTGGASGQILKYSASGTAVWEDEITIANNLTETVAGKALDATQGKALAEQIATKADKSTSVNKTLLAASWGGTEAPYTYTLTVTGVTATSINEVLPSVSITATELAALQKANVQDGGQAVDTITLKAFGTKPTVDIPIRVILRGDA